MRVINLIVTAGCCYHPDAIGTVLSLTCMFDFDDKNETLHIASLKKSGAISADAPC